LDQSSTASPNADQITYWNATAADKWIALHQRLDAQIGPLGEKALGRLALKPGESVLDVGCGCGHTTLELARRVGPSGAVTAADISKPMLAVAARDAAEADSQNISFIEADAQIYPFEAGAYDAVFSRFGVMFFSDPIAAFANLHSALKPGSGRLAFVCWRKLADNPWMATPLAAAMQHLPPQPRPDPEAPGPYAFADPERVKRILTQAGFADIETAPHDTTINLGTLDNAVEQAVRIGPLGRLLNEHPEAMDAVMETLRQTLSEFDSGAGVTMDAAVWIVSARAA
jgi:SAM-dependent methyltransferase